MSSLHHRHEKGAKVVRITLGHWFVQLSLVRFFYMLVFLNLFKGFLWQFKDDVLQVPLVLSELWLPERFEMPVDVLSTNFLVQKNYWL